VWRTTWSVSVDTFRRFVPQFVSPSRRLLLLRRFRSFLNSDGHAVYKCPNVPDEREVYIRSPAMPRLEATSSQLLFVIIGTMIAGPTDVLKKSILDSCIFVITPSLRLRQERSSLTDLPVLTRCITIDFLGLCR